MKNRKVLNLRTHLGGWLGKTSYDSEKDKCEMERWPDGVAIKSIKGQPLLYGEKKIKVICVSGNSNNIEYLVEAFDDATETKDAPDAKRGPGRPAKE